MPFDPGAAYLDEARRAFRGYKRMAEEAIAQVNGEKPDRHRDDEFIAEADDTRPALMQRWEANWKLVFDAIASLQPADLERVITIRGKEHTVLQAINRALLHYAYHIGQIVWLAKHFRSTEWKTLSIPKGQSETFGKEAEEKRMRAMTEPDSPYVQQ